MNSAEMGNYGKKKLTMKIKSLILSKTQNFFLLHFDYIASLSHTQCTCSFICLVGNNSTSNF